MEYKLIVKTLAEQDMTEAVEWYNKRAPHLMGYLIEEIDIAFGLLKKNPENYQKRYNEVRVFFTDTFPYGIFYTIEDSTIFIHAFLHTKRNPKTGTERI